MDEASNLVLETIKNRHSKRAFLPQEIPNEIITEVLKCAAQAPSSRNTQPWKVAVIKGKTLKKLSALMCEKFDQGIFEKPDYQYSPDPLPPEFLERARQCGHNLFKLKKIDRKDHLARKKNDRENYIFFNAPLLLVFYLPPRSERGNFLDMGFFIQNILLGLQSHGIASCPQTRTTHYSPIIKSTLKIPMDHIIVCTLSVGYADPQKKINQFIPPRLPLEEYTTWFD